MHHLKFSFVIDGIYLVNNMRRIEDMKAFDKTCHNLLKKFKDFKLSYFFLKAEALRFNRRDFHKNRNKSHNFNDLRNKTLYTNNKQLLRLS